MKHFVHTIGYSAVCGERGTCVSTIAIGDVTCHRCLEALVTVGDLAVKRIIELERASEAEGSSNGHDEATQPGSSPGGRSEECVCGNRFRTAEDYRDHLPCGREVEEDRVLVHADGGMCHGVILQAGRCPSCGIAPDMQSTEFWPRSKARSLWNRDPGM